MLSFSKLRSTGPTWAAAFLTACTWAGAAQAASAAETEPMTRPVDIKVGQPFPSIELPTLDGEVRSIEDFRGTKVVLHIFASW